MSVSRKLKSLYNQLPSIDIPCQDCIKCCMEPLIPWSTLEAELAHARTGRWPTFEQGKCCYCSIETGCTIYDIRPMMCRVYGLSDAKSFHMCERGLRTSNPIPEDKLHEIMDKYHKLVNSTGGLRIPIGAERYAQEVRNLNPNVKLHPDLVR